MIQIYSNQVNYYIPGKNALKIKTLSCLPSKFWKFEFDHRPSEVNSGQKYVRCWRAHNIIFYLFSIETHYLGVTWDVRHQNLLLRLSISYRFWDIRLQRFQGLTLTFDLQRLSEVKIVFTIRKPIHDFLSIFYLHFLSISYRFWDIWHQSFFGFDKQTFDF